MASSLALLLALVPARLGDGSWIAGVDRYDAGAGDDVVAAASGRTELVSCGGGRDAAVVDPVTRAG